MFDILYLTAPKHTHSHSENGDFIIEFTARWTLQGMIIDMFDILYQTDRQTDRQKCLFDQIK